MTWPEENWSDMTEEERDAYYAKQTKLMNSPVKKRVTIDDMDVFEPETGALAIWTFQQAEFHANEMSVIRTVKGWRGHYEVEDKGNRFNIILVDDIPTENGEE